MAPFRHQGYRRLAVSLVLQTFAAGVWTVAIVWEVIRFGGGPAQLSIVTTAGALGILLPALLGGVIADRIPQKSTLLAMTAVELVGMAVIAGLSLSGHNSVWSMAAVALLIGGAMAFYYPAYTAWLPALVPESDLMAVNGFEQMARPALLQAAGPAVAGGVVAAASPGWAVLVAVVASLGGVLALATVPRTAVRRDLAALGTTHPLAAAWHDIREGFGYMVRTPWLLGTLLFASLLVFLVMGPIEVLVPFLVKDRMAGGPEEHAWVLAAFGIGSALGALAMGSARMPRRYLTVMNLGWGVGALPMVVMGVTRSVAVLVIAAFALGVLFSAPMVIWGTLLQRRVPPHLLGRVSGLDFFVSLVFMPVSMAVAGPVAHFIGLEATFVLAGALPALLAVVAIVAFRLPADEIAHPLHD